MTLLKTNFLIRRNQQTGKKQYFHSDSKVPSIKPALPYNWQHITESSAQLDTPSFVIRCDDIIVIDCDDYDSTQAIDALIDDPNAYIVVSDKGEKHFYFTPSEKFNNSPLKRKARLSLAPIDLLQGTSLVFPVCGYNETKRVFNGTISSLTEVPDNVVEYLISLLKTDTIATSEDYKPNTSFLSPQVEQALGMYGRTANYKELEQLMRVITPYKYVHMVKPDYHPDRVADGDGTAYIQALSAKIAGDVSISPELHKELIGLITQQLWSDPFSDEQLSTFLSNLTTQIYPNGDPVFKYDPTIKANVLISIGGNEPTRLYRTSEDEYIIPFPTGGAKTIKREANLIKTLGSANYTMFLDGVAVPSSAVKQSLLKTSDTIDTVELVNEAYSNAGYFVRDNIACFNMYTPTKYLGIIRKEYLRDTPSKGPEAFPTISLILDNITSDHKDRVLISKLHQYLRMKATEKHQSPIVFQLLGNRGTGKDSWADLILSPIFGGVGEKRMHSSNSQFNADYTDKFFVKIPELIVNDANLNELKNMSGSKTTRQEAKGKDATTVQNINTYITSSNRPDLLAENMNERRFVLLASFKGERIQMANLDLLIALELEEYCLYLRDVKIMDPSLFMQATSWHDDVLEERFEEEATNFNNGPDLLAALIPKLNVLKGEEVEERLAEALGEGYHYWLGRSSKLCIPLKGVNGLVRTVDQAPITHNISKRELIARELAPYISKDTNQKRYTKRFDYLFLELTNDQYNYFDSQTTVAPIGETL